MRNLATVTTRSGSFVYVLVYSHYNKHLLTPGIFWCILRFFRKRLGWQKSSCLMKSRNLLRNKEFKGTSDFMEQMGANWVQIVDLVFHYIYTCRTLFPKIGKAEVSEVCYTLHPGFLRCHCFHQQSSLFWYVSIKLDGFASWQALLLTVKRSALAAVILQM